MPDALTVDFALTGVSKVTDGFSQISAVSGRADARIRVLSKSVKAATSDLRALNAQLVRYNRLSGSRGAAGAAPVARPAGSPGGSGGSPNAPLKPSPRTRFVQGPYQRRAMLQQQLTEATHLRDEDKILDVQQAVRANDARIKRIESPRAGMGGKLLDVLKTSRVSIGKGGVEGLEPLVGKLAGLAGEALGPEMLAVAGPVGLLASAAAAGAEKLHELAVSAAASGVAFNDRANALGSSGASAGMVGALAGVDGAGQASAYNSAISGGGLGTYAGYREGQNNLSNPMVSNLDIGQQYWNAMEARRHMSRDDQLRQAQMTGTMGSMGLMSMSEQQWQIAKQQGLAQSRIMDGTAGPSVDFQQSEAGLKAATDNLTTAFGAPLLNPLKDFENGLAGATNGLAAIASGKSSPPPIFGALSAMLASPRGPMQGVLGMMMSSPPGPLLGLAGIVSAAGAAQGGGGDSASPLTGKSETASNTEATNKLTAQMRELAKSMPGTFGAQDSSGRRAGAFPSEIGPNNVMARNEAIKAKMVYSAF